MDDIETREVNLFNRDQVLGKVDDLLKIEDDAERAKEISEFIDDRLKLLTENSTPQTFSVMSKPKRGFLYPESGIKRSFIVDPFLVDDPEIYKQVIETFKEFRANPDWQGKTLREIAPFAILRTIGNYFGNHWGTENTENNNRVFYMDRSGVDSEDIHMSELKGKKIAVCAEKAAAAQNLLSFLGYDSELIASSKCRLESLEKDDQGGHMYNLITSGDNHLIFDPANPTLLTKDDSSIYMAMPAFYPIDQDDYKRLMSGGQVEVTHNDRTWDGQQTHMGPDQKRIYGGPNQTVAI